MKLGVLFTGGKDSCLALYKVKNDVVCLITMISENPDSYMFHTSNIEIAKLQAKSMNLPIIIGKTIGEKEKELIDLKKLIKKAINEYKIEGIVTGALFSEYQSSRIENICKELKIKCINPLWHMNPEDELKELIDNNFEFIITSIAADGLDKSWLNKLITEKEIIKLKELNKKYGINIIFEGGKQKHSFLMLPYLKKRL